MTPVPLMSGCEQILANMGISSDVGLTNVVALLASTAFFPADGGLAGLLVLVAAGNVIANVECGTTNGGENAGTPCGAYHPWLK